MMESPRKKYGVLFVCTGNICRSPTAEGIFAHKLSLLGLSDHFHFDSAGTGGWHEGEPPDPRSMAMAASYGVDISGLRARTVRDDDFKTFDILVAMDNSHFDFLRRHKRAKDASIRRLLEFTGHDGDVPDPYYAGQKEFRQVYELIERGVDGLIAHLQQGIKI